MRSPSPTLDPSNPDIVHGPPARSGPRTRRRAGALVLVAGAAMIVFALVGNRWWSMALTAEDGQAHVGLTTVEMCVAERTPRCLPLAEQRAAFSFAVSLDIDRTADGLAEFRDWLESRRTVRWALWAAIIAVLAIAAIATGYWPHPQLRAGVLGAGAVVVVAGLLALRLLGTVPIANLHRDLHADLAMGGLAILVLGLAMIGSAVVRAHPE